MTIDVFLMLLFSFSFKIIAIGGLLYTVLMATKHFDDRPPADSKPNKKNRVSQSTA